ncbi:hypothetical protein pb186bvf_008580 [Paramecium bursaria]
MIQIVSFDGHSQEFNVKLIDHCQGLQAYDPNEKIVFDKIITKDFLIALHQFYDGNDYDEEKLKVTKIVKSNELTDWLSAHNAQIFQQTFQDIQKQSSFKSIIQYIQGADLFGASAFKDLVNMVLSILIHTKQLSDYEIKQYQKNWSTTSCAPIIEEYINKIVQEKYLKILEGLETNDNPQANDFNPADFQDNWEEE